MVVRFRRSLSFSGGRKSCGSPCRRPYTATKPYYARLTSLLCRSHPDTSLLHDELNSLRSLPAFNFDCTSSSSWLAEGLDRIGRVHSALAELLHRPQETPLRGHPAAAKWADRLIDDALRLADAYISLRSAAAELKDHMAEARAAIRRDDSARLSAAVRCHSRTNKELTRLAVVIKRLTKSSPTFDLDRMEDAVEVEVAGIVREVMTATATASAAIFAGMAAVSSSTAGASSSTAMGKNSRSFWSLKKLTSSKSFKKRGESEEDEAEMVALEKMEGLEECIGRLDEGIERVFRSLINTRVLLLNSLTPA